MLVIHNNRETVVALSVRMNDHTIDPEDFFKGFHFGLAKKKDNPGTPGVPGTPGAPPGVPGPPPGKGPNPKGGGGEDK